MATSVPPGKQTFFDPETGALLSLGTVTHYIPSTTLFKNTWADEDQTEVNTNPILLDGTGSCSIWGNGLYRQIVRDSAGNLIWDRITGFGGATEEVLILADVAEMRTYPTGHLFNGQLVFLRGHSDPNDGGQGWFNVDTGAPGADNNGTIIASNTAGFYYVRSYSGAMFPEWFNAKGDGVTNDRPAFLNMLSAAAPGQEIFLQGNYRFSAQVAPGKRLRWNFTPGAGFTFTDGAYVAFLLTGAACNQTEIVNGVFQGTVATNPAIILLKITGAAAYCKVRGGQFFNASIGVYLTNTYIDTLSELDFNTCDTYLKTSDAEGSCVDIDLVSLTFGSVNGIVATNACVDFLSTGTRLKDAYFETQEHVKNALLLRTGCQNIDIDATMEVSGDVVIQTSVDAAMHLVATDSYNSAVGTPWLVRIAGGSRCVLSGNLKWTNIVANIEGVDASGTLIANGLLISKAAVGINSAGSGAVTGCTITACTTGYKASSGNTQVVVGNNFDNNLTWDIDIAGGTPMIDFNRATLVRTSTIAGSRMGNSPAVSYPYELYGSATWNPGNVIDGASTSTTVAVTGATANSKVWVSFSLPLQGMILAGEVSAADTVTVVLSNTTGGALDLASGTLDVIVRRA